MKVVFLSFGSLAWQPSSRLSVMVTQFVSLLSSRSLHLFWAGSTTQSICIAFTCLLLSSCGYYIIYDCSSLTSVKFGNDIWSSVGMDGGRYIKLKT